MSRTGLASSLAALATVLLPACGCAPRRADLVREGTVRVQTHPSPRVEIFWVSACQHGEHVDVTGHARSSHRSGFASHGHIDISLLAPDGRLLAEQRTQDIHIPAYRRRQAPSGRRFHACLPISPPSGSTLRMAFHSGDHEVGATAAAR